MLIVEIISPNTRENDVDDEGRFNITRPAYRSTSIIDRLERRRHLDADRLPVHARCSTCRCRRTSAADSGSSRSAFGSASKANE